MRRVGGKRASGRPRPGKAPRSRQGSCRGRRSWSRRGRRHCRSGCSRGAWRRRASRCRGRRAGDESLRSGGQGRSRNGDRDWTGRWGLHCGACFSAHRTGSAQSGCGVGLGPWCLRGCVAQPRSHGGWRRRGSPTWRGCCRRVLALRLNHQLSDALNRGRLEAGQRAGLDVEAPLLNALDQLLTLQAQFFGQLVNANRQRQLLPASVPVSQAGRDLGVVSMVRIDHRD
jgi:hypothetical protein